MERAPTPAGFALESGEQVGDRIGPYKLLEQIGEGGFGIVYVAEQDEPIRRRVALKIIKLGMDTRQVIARFEVERQALALMEHPNIAKVFDAGATETGRPYFVMELVRGVPLTRFCDEHRLSPEQRLRLFTEVCEAVQHAHQKGIIHRDLKPSNILVTMNGSRAVPKVIDFGIAKATHDRLTDKTLYTRFHQFIGTPEYMSPEQAELSEAPVDTRSDIYSLGVLLYELLVGRPPFAAKELLKAGFDQVRRILREEEPLSPSRQLSRLDRAELTTTAERRRCAPQQLLGWFRGDLEHVVLKAIEKDVDRRYASAAALAEDIQHFLNQEPVTAVPPSQVYLLRKFVRRHRMGVVAGGLVVGALLLGLGLSVAGFVKASRANARAKREAATATATLNFIQEGLLGRLDPFVNHAGDEEWGRNLTLLEAVRTAAEDLGNQFADQPLVEASLSLTIGRTYLRLNEAEAAGPHLERAIELFTQQFGPDDARTLEARQHQAEFLSRTGRSAEAIPMLEQVVKSREKLLGSDAHARFESLNALAWALFDANSTNYPRAETLFHQVIAGGSASLSQTDPLVLRAKEGLSEIAYQRGDYDEFLRLGDEVYAARRQVLGPEHPDFLYSAALRAYDLRYRLGDFHAAEALGNEVLETCRRVLGPDHPTTLLMVMEKGMRLGVRGLRAQAVESRRELVQTARRRYGDEHPTTLWAEDLLGGALRVMGDFIEAEAIHRTSVAIRDRTGQTQTSAHRRSRRWLSLAVFEQGRVEEAQQLYETVVEQTREAHGDISPTVLYNASRVVVLLGSQADWPGIVRHYLELAPHDSAALNANYPLGQLPLPAGILSAQLADDASATTKLLELLMDRLAGNTNLMVARQIALTGLSLDPHVLSETHRKEILRMGSVVVNESPDPLERALVSGMLLYRKGAFAEAAGQLEGLSRNPDHAVASTAGFVTAMTRLRQGRTENASRMLSRATETLEVGLQPGLLGHRAGSQFGYNLRWADYARSLVLRAEAEALVLGRIVSPPVNREPLKARRAAWQSTQALLEAAHQRGRSRDWAKARELFARAMDQGPINWEEEGNLIPWLHLKAASVFALTGDTNRYAALCRQLVDPAAVSQSYGRIALLWPAGGASKLESRSPKSEIRSEVSGSARDSILTRAIEMARWDAAQIKSDDRPATRHEWTWLRLGIAEYRAGNFTAALSALAKARNALNLAAAGTACALSALAAQANGQPAEAARFLQQAEANHQQLLDGNPDRFGQGWHDVAILELALREARAAVLPADEP